MAFILHIPRHECRKTYRYAVAFTAPAPAWRLPGKCRSIFRPAPSPTKSILAFMAKTKSCLLRAAQVYRISVFRIFAFTVDDIHKRQTNMCPYTHKLVSIFNTF